MDKQTDKQADRIHRLLRPMAETKWNGPDSHPRVEKLIKEQTMSSKKFSWSRTSIAIAVCTIVGGGALATVVTQQILAGRATLITEDGSQYDIELVPDGDAATGTFIADDGTVYGINMVQESDGQKQVTVEVSGDSSGSSTVTVESDDD